MSVVWRSKLFIHLLIIKAKTFKLARMSYVSLLLLFSQVCPICSWALKWKVVSRGLPLPFSSDTLQQLNWRPTVRTLSWWCFVISFWCFVQFLWLFFPDPTWAARFTHTEWPNGPVKGSLDWSGLLPLMLLRYHDLLGILNHLNEWERADNQFYRTHRFSSGRKWNTLQEMCSREFDARFLWHNERKQIQLLKCVSWFSV